MQNREVQKPNLIQQARWRTVLILLLTFMVNALLLSGYFKFFLSQRSSDIIAERYGEVRSQMRDQLDEITRAAQQQKDWQGYLLDRAEENQIIIEVLDQHDQPVLVIPSGARGFTISITDMIVVEGEPYLVRAEYPFSVDIIAGMQPSTTLFFTELLLLLICTMLSGQILYSMHIRPLEQMRNIVEGYRRGVKPPVSMRKDELGNLQNSFVELTDSIETEKLKQKQIIASISHDIKTPLTSIMGYAERLQNSNLPPERTERYLNTIYEKSCTIKQLVEEFDEYLSFDRQSELKRELIDITELIELLRRDVEGELAELSVQLEVQCTCQSKLLVDIAKMRRVFGNLVSNSVKHFGDEPNKQIRVLVVKTYGYVRIIVEDNGTGVEPERLRHIFDPFYTSDQGRRVAGLGLSICQEIVRAHEGHIWAENMEKGLRVCIELKIANT